MENFISFVLVLFLTTRATEGNLVIGPNHRMLCFVNGKKEGEIVLVSAGRLSGYNKG